jgi:hypothetical protein
MPLLRLCCKVYQKQDALGESASYCFCVRSCRFHYSASISDYEQFDSFGSGKCEPTLTIGRVERHIVVEFVRFISPPKTYVPQAFGTEPASDRHFREQSRFRNRLIDTVIKNKLLDGKNESQLNLSLPVSKNDPRLPYVRVSKVDSRHERLLSSHDTLPLPPLCCKGFLRRVLFGLLLRAAFAFCDFVVADVGGDFKYFIVIGTGLV